MNPVCSGVVAVCLVVLPGFAVAQVNADEPIKTTLCEIVKEPEHFNFTMVQFRAKIHAGFETSWLSDGSCSVYFTYGSDAFTKGHEGQEYAFVPVVRDPQNPSRLVPDPHLEFTFDPLNPLSPRWTLHWKPVGTPPWVTLRRDAAFEKMEKYIGERVEYRNGKSCFYCSAYEVSATVVGRFDHMESPMVAFGSIETGMVTYQLVGFGHLNAALSQVVLKSVSDVVVKPIDPSVYEKER